MNRGKRIELFNKVFEREWNERFQLVDENGTPIKSVRKWKDNDEELTEEEMGYEMELMGSIGEYLDSVLEKIESKEEGA